MTRTMYKLFWAWEPDKEEAWLNEMSARGLVFPRSGGTDIPLKNGSQAPTPCGWSF